MDKLEEIFSLQQYLNDEIVKKRGLEGIGRDEWLQKLTLAALSELAELIEGANFKWWKEKREVDDGYLKDEVVDIVHFVVSMALRCGMDADELYERYVAKHRENLARQHGESNKPGYVPENPDSKLE